MLLVDDELPVKWSKEACSNTTLFRETLKRYSDARNPNFSRLCLQQVYAFLAFRGRRLIKPTSPKWLLSGSFLSLTAWHLNTAAGFIDWSIWPLCKQNVKHIFTKTVERCRTLPERMPPESFYWWWGGKSTPANRAESLETNKREMKIKRQRFDRGPLWFTYPSDPSVISEVRWVSSAELLLMFSALLSLQDHYKRNYNSWQIS